MLNKIPTEDEIFGSKVDHVPAGNDQNFLQSFDLEGRYQKTEGKQGVSRCGFFFVMVFIIE
jgi:hypothetical protein